MSATSPDQAGRAPEWESTREAILGTASGVFLAHGYELSSIDEIALESGVARRTVYDQFASERALFGGAGPPVAVGPHLSALWSASGSERGTALSLPAPDSRSARL